MPELHRTPDERFENLPGYDLDPHWHDADGLRLHYVDEGAGSPVVCFHGEPSWAYLYRKMVPGLVEAGHRMVCPDLPGFGRSDKPTERGWYSYDRHVECVSRFWERSICATRAWSFRTGAGRLGCAGRWRTPIGWRRS